MSVPSMRAAAHKLTAPKPQREAHAKPRVRSALKKPEKQDDDKEVAMMCERPPLLADAPSIEPTRFEPPQTNVPRLSSAPSFDQRYIPTMCNSVRSNYNFAVGFGAIPEPATWAQMVLGFGVLGGVIRAARKREHYAAV